MEVTAKSSTETATKRWSELSALLLGCGSIGRRHARVLASLGVHDLRVYDPDRAQVDRLRQELPQAKAEDSFDAALERPPDTVFVLTPPASHVGLAIRSLEAGCHVFCEKPLSFAVTELDRLRPAIDRSGKCFAVGLCFRYHPGLVAAKQRIKEGAIGRLVSIRAQVGEHLPTVRPDYRRLFSSRYLGAFDLIHDLDLALWFAGFDPSRAQSIHGTFSDVDMEAPDVAEIVMEFPNRCVASVHLNLFQKPRRRSIELLGTEGTLRVEFGSWDHYSIEELTEASQQTREFSTERDEMFRGEDRDFLECAAAGAAVPIGFAEGARSIRVLTTIYPELARIAEAEE